MWTREGGMCVDGGGVCFVVTDVQAFDGLVVCIVFCHKGNSL